MDHGSTPQTSRSIALAAASVTVVDQDGQGRVTLEPTTLDLGQERIALIGSNGQGKTTLLRAIAGLQPLSSGHITVDGADVVTEPKRIRSQVGFLFADAAAQLIMPTVEEDVQLSLKRLGLRRGDRRTRARELLDQAGLGHLAERSVYALSGGERQLVALTGLLAVSPSVILADEPTSALDLVNRAQVVQELLRLPARLLVATHDLELARACDRVLWIHAGAVAADGEPDRVVDEYVAAAGSRL